MSVEAVQKLHGSGHVAEAVLLPGFAILIAKPGIKTASVSWPDPYTLWKFVPALTTAYHALYEFDQTIRDLYVPRPNGRGGMTRTPTPPIGLKVEEAMASAKITDLVCPLRAPGLIFNFEGNTYYPCSFQLFKSS